MSILAQRNYESLWKLLAFDGITHVIQRHLRATVVHTFFQSHPPDFDESGIIYVVTKSRADEIDVMQQDTTGSNLIGGSHLDRFLQKKSATHTVWISFHASSNSCGDKQGWSSSMARRLACLRSLTTSRRIPPVQFSMSFAGPSITSVPTFTLTRKRSDSFVNGSNVSQKTNKSRRRSPVY